MNDYQPIPLTYLCNVGIDFLSSGIEPRIGSQTYYGLPFLIGDPDPNPARCLLGFGGETGSTAITIPLHTTARNILIAHTLLESRLNEGEPVGCLIAHYVFHYADGDAVRVPIRERFEIAIIPSGWGQRPFLAWTDLKDDRGEVELDGDRYRGHWGATGERQTEAVRNRAASWYLWAWSNPQPERPLASLTIEPGDRKFVVAAITLGHADEFPFPRSAARPVKISLPQSEDASKPFDLAVEVDRGMATYPYPLPAAASADFLADSLKGFGESLNQSANPAYVEVTAIPSATVEVKHQGEVLAAVNWGELSQQGALETPRVWLEIADPGRNWVRVTVVDEATGHPVPCRVHFRSPEGIPFQPHGHHNHVHSNLGTWHIDVGGDLRLGQISYAYINGECQGWLPRGEVIVDVARGFEYEPLRTSVQIEPGQQELTLRLKRWTDMNAKRWFSGDSHVHFLGAGGAHSEAQGEDLNIVNLLQSQWGHLFTNAEDALGLTTSNGGKTMVYCSQENRQHMLGHITLWGLKTPVMPWCTDGPDEAELGGSLEIALAHWADATRAQGGTVIIPHLPNPNGEPAALIATGRADAAEMIDFAPYKHTEYYRYLNCGYRLPLVGGTDKMDSAVPVGLYRTYAYVPPDEEFTYENWSKAVRAGRTFLSGGPLIEFSVDGRQIGDTVTLSSAGTVEVIASAESIFPIHTLEIVQNGRVIASANAAGGARRLQLRERVQVEGHGWLAARCSGSGYHNALSHHDCWQRGIFAHTSPIYVAVGATWSMFDRETAQYMLTLIDGNLSYIQQRALHYPAQTTTHHHGEADHLAYLERPFREAMAAIHQRMHVLGIAH